MSFHDRNLPTRRPLPPLLPSPAKKKTCGSLSYASSTSLSNRIEESSPAKRRSKGEAAPSTSAERVLISSSLLPTRQAPEELVVRLLDVEEHLRSTASLSASSRLTVDPKEN